MTYMRIISQKSPCPVLVLRYDEHAPGKNIWFIGILLELKKRETVLLLDLKILMNILLENFPVHC